MKKFFQLHIPGAYAILAVGLFMAAILWTSTQTSPQIEGGGAPQVLLDHLLDFAHFPIYAVLAFLIVLAFDDRSFSYLFAAFFIAVIFGIFNEFIQSYVPGREFSVKDMVVNACGALTALVILRKFS